MVMQVTRNSQFHIVVETRLHSCHLDVQSLIHQELLFAVKVQYWCSMMCITSSAGYKYCGCSHFLHFHPDDSKFPISSSQQNLFFTSFSYYPFMCWCNSTQILEDECMCCLVVEFSTLSGKSYWAVVLTLFTQCTNLQNAVYTLNIKTAYLISVLPESAGTLTFSFWMIW